MRALLLSACTLLSSLAAALAPMPTARYGLGAAVVDGKLYAIGGMANGVALGLVERYDPDADRWQPLDPMPTPRGYFGVAVVGKKIFALGGDDLTTRLDTAEVFDTATGRWSSLPPMPRRGSALAVAALGDSVYVAGGSPLVNEDTVADVSVLDARSGRWSAAPPMLAVRNTAGAAVLAGRLWVTGGVSYRGGRQRVLSSVESFSPVTQSWRAEPGLPWDGSGNAAVAGGALYVFGGSDGSRADIDTMAVYDGAAWTPAPAMPTGRSSFAAASDGRRIFVVGGSPGRNIELDSLEVYDTASKTWRVSRRGEPPQARVAVVTKRAVQVWSKPQAAAPYDDLPSPRAAPARAEDYALVIGLEDYRSVPRAEFGRQDAEAFARYARTSLGVPEENVITLTGERATKTDIAKYVEEWLPRNVSAASRVYVYYSGHGAPDPERGDSYLLPWDGDPQFLQTTGYPIASLYQRLQALPAKRVIVFLDSCFSGAGGRSVVAKNLRPLVQLKSTPLPSASKLTVLTASGSSQVAGGYEPKAHGLFTYYLLRGLGGEAARGEHLDVSDLYSYVRANVRKQAHRENREQDPQLQTSTPQLRLY